MALSNEMIEKMLDDLKENQEQMRKEYNERIDKVDTKIEKIDYKLDQCIETIKKEIKEQTSEQNKTFVSRVEFQYTQDKIKQLEEGKNKLVRIVITAVIGAVLSMIFIHN
jgi:nitrogen regulatory protein PII